MASQLTQFQTDDQALSLMQNSWATQLNPLLKSPAVMPNILKDVSLAVGTNVINHKLARKLQGWRIADINGAAQIYRSAPLNDLTLTLTSDAVVTITLEVY